MWNERINGGDSHINTPVSVPITPWFSFVLTCRDHYFSTLPPIPFALRIFYYLEVTYTHSKEEGFFPQNANIIVFLKPPGKS